MKLQMATSRKLAVIAMFLLGSLVVITGIVRLAYVIKAFGGLKSNHADVTCESSVQAGTDNILIVTL